MYINFHLVDNLVQKIYVVFIESIVVNSTKYLELDSIGGHYILIMLEGVSALAKGLSFF